MLLELGFRNFFSFKEGVVISTEVPGNAPDAVINKFGTVSLLGIKGANGSGKTNILRAFAFLTSFLTKSFQLDPEKNLDIRSFFESEDPSDFYIRFSLFGTEYEYELSVDNKKVHRECLYKKLKRKTKLFERIENNLTYVNSNYKDIENIPIRSNASIIAASKHTKSKSLSKLHLHFTSWFSNVSFTGRNNGIGSIFDVAKILNSHPNYLKFVSDFISECDGGVERVEIREVTNEDGEKLLAPFFIHKNNSLEFPVPINTESSGTKELFKFLLFYKLAIDTGGLLALDEFDINIHPHILPKLLELFDSEEKNQFGAQLIFSTHNSEIIDSLGRYRCYLVNKEQNESYSYRLDEIPGEIIRNGRSIYPAYKRGDLGGVPKL